VEAHGVTFKHKAFSLLKDSGGRMPTKESIILESIKPRSEKVASERYIGYSILSVPHTHKNKNNL